MVSLDSPELGVIEIYVGLIPEPIPTYEAFPVEIVNEFYEKGNIAHKVIPSLDGADVYTGIVSFDEENGDCYGSVVATFNGEESIGKTAYEGYLEALIQAGFDYREDEAIGYRYFSPDNEYVVSVEFEGADYYTGYSVVKIYFDNIVDGQI